MSSLKRPAVSISSDESSSDGSSPERHVEVTSRHKVENSQATKRTKLGPVASHGEESQTLALLSTKLRDVQSSIDANGAKRQALLLMKQKVNSDRAALIEVLHDRIGQRAHQEDVLAELRSVAMEQVPELKSEADQLGMRKASRGSTASQLESLMQDDSSKKSEDLSSLFATARRLGQSCHNLVARYQEMNCTSGSLLRPLFQNLRGQWHQDKLETENLLKAGEELSRYRIEHMIPKSTDSATCLTEPDDLATPSYGDHGKLNSKSGSHGNLQHMFEETIQHIEGAFDKRSRDRAA